MPNPFEKRRVTQAEREEILRKARQEWDAVGEHQIIFGNRTDQDYLQAVDAGLEVIGGEYREPEPQNAFEKQEFEDRIVYEDHLERLRIPIPGKELTGIPAIDRLTKENNDREMAKFLQPANDAQTAAKQDGRGRCEANAAKSQRRFFPTIVGPSHPANPRAPGACIDARKGAGIF